MTNKELLEWCTNNSEENGFIEFSDELYDSISKSQAKMLAELLSHTTFMKLPSSEIRFFEWLKEHDRKIWDDLWEGVDEKPYIVGVSFLPLLKEEDGRGFPICDLVNNDNYYFSTKYLVGEESKVWLDSSREMYIKNEVLTTAQLLALEISAAPIDLWHFAYKYGIEPDQVKRAVEQLVDDKVLVHLTEASYLAGFIDF